MSRLKTILRQHEEEITRIDNVTTVNDWISGVVLFVCIYLYFAFPF